jgi:hypothetical protein
MKPSCCFMLDPGDLNGFDKLPTDGCEGSIEATMTYDAEQSTRNLELGKGARSPIISFRKMESTPPH